MTYNMGQNVITFITLHSSPRLQSAICNLLRLLILSSPSSEVNGREINDGLYAFVEFFTLFVGEVKPR